MKILVIGKFGQVGQCLVKRLSEKQYSFVAFSRDELDITHPVELTKTLIDEQPDIIINAAAYTAVDQAESNIDTANVINHIASENLAKAANSIDAILLHISTDYVFSGQGTEPYTELDNPDPQSIYGRTKLDGELAIQSYCNKYIILRTAWVFSAQGNNFVNTMLRLGADRPELSVVADQFGAPTAADDIALTLIEMARQLFSGKTAYGIYHYSGMPYVNWFEFANAIFSIAQKKGLITPPHINPITSRDYPTPAKRPLNSRLNNQKIYDNFGILPCDWHLALEKIIG